MRLTIVLTLQHQANAGLTRYFLTVDVHGKPVRSTWLHRLGGSAGNSYAQKLRAKFVQNASTSQSTGRNQEFSAGRRLVSLFALAGFSLQAGTPKVELEDRQFDLICKEIMVRENCHFSCILFCCRFEITCEVMSVSPLQKNVPVSFQTLMEPSGKQAEEELTMEEIQLSDLEIGPLIAKGSNSAVYGARFHGRI